MSDGALCLIGDNCGARPVLCNSSSVVNETNVSHVAFSVETAVNGNTNSHVGFDNVSQSFIIGLNQLRCSKMTQHLRLI